MNIILSSIIFIYYYIYYFSSEVIRLLEKTLQRPLHWFVCMFNENELPLRHLLAKKV